MNTPARNPAAVRRPPVSQTLAQVANQRVNQQLAPQIAAQNAFNARQTNVIQQFANALLGKLQPIAGQVGADYNQAIQQTGALSGQAAQFLQNANPTPQVQALLQSAGAPQEQQAQIAQQLGNTFGGGSGVLAFTGGTIPGSELAADKAAAQGAAAQLPGFAALKGQQDLASALWQQGQDRQTLEAQRPALYQQAAQDIRQNNAARASAAHTAQQDRISNQFKAAGLRQSANQFAATETDKRTAAKTKAVADARAAKRQAANDFIDKYVKLTKLGLDTTKLEQDYQTSLKRVAISQQQANTSATNAATSRMNANTSAVRAQNQAINDAESRRQANARLKLAQRHERAYERSSAGKAKAKNHGFTASQAAKLRGNAFSIANGALNGIPAGGGTTKWNAEHPNGLPAIGYKDAVSHMQESGIPDWIYQPILTQVYGPLLKAGKQLQTSIKKVTGG